MNISYKLFSNEDIFGNESQRTTIADSIDKWTYNNMNANGAGVLINENLYESAQDIDAGAVNMDELTSSQLNIQGNVIFQGTSSSKSLQWDSNSNKLTVSGSMEMIGSANFRNTITVKDIIINNSLTGNNVTCDINATTFDLDATGLVSLDSSGAIEINSSNAAISIGNKNNAQNINIGTNGNRTIAIGNATASALNVKANVFHSEVTTFDIDATKFELDTTGIIEINSSNAAISIGNDAINKKINIGTNGNRTIAVGNATATVDIDASTLILKKSNIQNLVGVNIINIDAINIILNPSEEKTDMKLNEGSNDSQIVNIINISTYKIIFNSDTSASKLKKTNLADYNTLLPESAMQCIWITNSESSFWYQIIGLKN